MVKQELADELKIDVDSLVLNEKFRILQFLGITGTGASAASTLYANVPFKKWKPVDAYIQVIAAGASTVAEKCRIGLLVSDAGSTDDDYIGTIAQDVTGGKNWAAGDCCSIGNNPMLGAPLAGANAGTITVVAGVGIGVIQSGAGILTLIKDNVGSSTATLVGYALIEVLA